jgi:hypothetical protein
MLSQNGGRVQSWDAVGGDNQLFKFVRQGDGTYRIICKANNKGLDFSTETINENGGKVQTWDPTGGSNQTFRLDAQ